MKFWFFLFLFICYQANCAQTQFIEDAKFKPVDVFIEPNEHNFYLFNRVLKKQEGVYLGLGTFRVFQAVSQGNFTHAFAFDLSKEVTEFNQYLLEIIESSETNKIFIRNLNKKVSDFRGWTKNQQKEWERFCDRMNAYLNDSVQGPESFLLNESAYQKLRKIILEKRFYVVRGDLSGAQSFQSVSTFLKNQSLKLGVLDISNSITFIQRYRGGLSHFLKNISTIPRTDEALVLLTDPHFSEDSPLALWDYYAFPYKEFRNKTIEIIGKKNTYEDVLKLNSNFKINVEHKFPQESPLLGEHGYVIPNELDFYLSEQILKNSKDVYVGVGTFRVFQAAATGEFSHVFALDHSPEVYRFNSYLIEVLKNSRDGEHFFQELISGKTKKTQFKIDLECIHDFVRVLKQMNEVPLRKKSLFLNDSVKFEKIKKLALEGRIILLQGKLEGLKTFPALSNYLKENNLKIGVLDLSNTFAYIINSKAGPTSSYNYLKTLESLPFSGDSKVLLTILSENYPRLTDGWEYYGMPTDRYLKAAKGFSDANKSYAEFRQFVFRDSKKYRLDRCEVPLK